MAENPTIPPITRANRKIIQKIVGLFQYYARTIDGTMLSSISSIATNMTTAQQKDLKFYMNQSLNYTATHPDAKIRYIASVILDPLRRLIPHLTSPNQKLAPASVFFLSQQETKSSH